MLHTPLWTAKINKSNITFSLGGIYLLGEGNQCLRDPGKLLVLGDLQCAFLSQDFAKRHCMNIPKGGSCPQVIGYICI